MRKLQYKYGIVLLTNNPDIVEKFGVEDGIYVAIETPVDLDARMIDGKKWLASWLDNAKSSLWRKLNDKTD